MNDRLPSGPTRLFGAEARIVMPWLVEEFVRTIRQIAPYQRGDGIHHDTELSFRWVHLTENLLDDIALLRWRRESLPRSRQPVNPRPGGEIGSLPRPHNSRTSRAHLLR